MVYVLFVWKDIICNYVSMCECMHDIIVVDDCNSGAQRQAEPARPRCTSHLCCMCVLFPFPGVSCYPLLFCLFCYVRCCRARLCCMRYLSYHFGFFLSGCITRCPTAIRAAQPRPVTVSKGASQVNASVVPA